MFDRSAFRLQDAGGVMCVWCLVATGVAAQASRLDASSPPEMPLSHASQMQLSDGPVAMGKQDGNAMNQSPPNPFVNPVDRLFTEDVSDGHEPVSTLNRHRSDNVIITDTIAPFDDRLMPFGNVALGQSITGQLTIANPSDVDIRTLTTLLLNGYHYDDFEDGIAQLWSPLSRPGALGPEWQVVNGAYQGGPSNLTEGFKETGTRVQNFGDVEFEVTARHLESQSTFLYLMVRNFQSAGGSYLGGTNYAVGFTGGGGVVLYVRQTNGVLVELLPSTIRVSLRPAPQPNKVRFRVQGNLLSVYFNDYLAVQVTNTALGGISGGVALAHSTSLVNGVSPVVAVDELSMRRLTVTDAFRLVGHPAIPAVIEPDGSLSFDVVARSTSLGPASGVLHLVSSEPSPQFLPVNISLEGVAPPVGLMTLTDSSAPVDDGVLEFPVTAANEQSNGAIIIANADAVNPLEIVEVELLTSRVETFSTPAAPGWIPDDGDWSAQGGEYGLFGDITPDRTYFSHWGDIEMDVGIVSAEIRHDTPGSTWASYLVFNASPGFVPSVFGSAHMVGITRAGSFNIGLQLNGDFFIVQPWTESPAIKNDGTPNRITVSTLDDRFKVWINDTEVANGSYPPWAGPNPTMRGFGLQFHSGDGHRAFFGNVRVDGVDAPSPFALNGVSLPVTVGAGDTLQLPVTFAPTSGGRFDGLVRVKSDSFPSPIDAVVLLGTSPSGAIPFDFDGDGVITVADVTYLGNSVAGIGPPLSLEEGDVNDDGVVDLQDAAALSLMVVD